MSLWFCLCGTKGPVKGLQLRPRAAQVLSPRMAFAESRKRGFCLSHACSSTSSQGLHGYHRAATNSGAFPTGVLSPARLFRSRGRAGDMKRPRSPHLGPNTLIPVKMGVGPTGYRVPPYQRLPGCLATPELPGFLYLFPAMPVLFTTKCVSMMSLKITMGLVMGQNGVTKGEERSGFGMALVQ